MIRLGPGPGWTWQPGSVEVSRIGIHVMSDQPLHANSIMDKVVDLLSAHISLDGGLKTVLFGASLQNVDECVECFS